MICMKSICIGDNFQIQCYKHNGKVHRFWKEAVIIDIKKDYIVCANNRTLVIESDGSTRKTREPAIMYFFKNRWFNNCIIIMVIFNHSFRVF